jgi:hypothetical protein
MLPWHQDSQQIYRLILFPVSLSSCGKRSPLFAAVIMLDHEQDS